ncbi:MAG: anti-sigma factor antagonist [Clostridia bacterium]|nr:anti-sigma factor antagonist [Clostridia bacterium]
MLKKNCTLELDGNREELTVILRGEIDHYTAAWVRSEIDASISELRPKRTVFVLSEIDFMDSSGIGLIMGRYAKMQNIGGTLAVRDPSDRVERIFKLAGLERIIELEKGEKNNEN